MRKNRKIPKKMSVVASNTMHFGAVIVILSVMVILNLLAGSSCTQLMKTIGEKERELVKLEDSKMRESTRWEEMKTPERVEEALRAHGLAMATPRAYQVVRMRADGTPFPGQLSVLRSRQRTVDQTAQYRRGKRR
jgi:hypothetical protein